MSDLKFTHTHEWLRLLNEEEALIGITDHAQELLGDLVFIELPEIGLTVNAGEELGVVESVKAAADFYAPVSGIVIAVNSDLSADPTLISQDPYGAGWLVKMRLTDSSQLQDLLDESQYTHEISEDK